MPGEPGRIRCYRHAILNGRGTRRKQPLCTGNLDNAHAARPHWSNAFKIAEGRDVFPILTGGLQDRLTLGSADQLAIDSN